MTPRDTASRAAAIGEVAAALRHAVAGFTDSQLDAPYRPGGRAVRPVVRHFLDSHLNGYIRTNLALTEETTTSKTYDEARWAEMADGHGRNAETSMVLLETLHRQWTARFESLAPADFAHPLRHPEVGDVTVDDVVSLHAWHGRHDVVLITALQEFED